MDGHDRRNRPCRSHRLPGYSLFTCQRSSALELAPNGKACLSQSCLRASRRARLKPFSAPGRFRRNLRCAWRGSRQCALRMRGGGGERDRTDDLLLAKQALSQLSYTPANSGSARVCGRRAPAALLRRESPHRADCPLYHRGAARSSFLRRAAPAAASLPLTRPHTNDALRRSVVGQGGFEPPTSRLSSARSNQLSY